MADGFQHLGGGHGAFGVRLDGPRGLRLDVIRPRRIGDELVADADPHVGARGPGAAGERARHPRQELLVRVRVAEPFGELREHLVRRGALAVDEPVGEPLRAAPGRLERERDDRRRPGGQHRVRLAPHDRADAHDDGDVDDGDEDRERSEQQRPVDHDVDVEQVVPQHGDPDRDRDRPNAMTATVWRIPSHVGVALVAHVVLSEKTSASA